MSFPELSYAEAQKLEYVDACIWEGIRMWPPLFGTKAKVVPQGDDTIKVYIIQMVRRLACAMQQYVETR